MFLFLCHTPFLEISWIQIFRFFFNRQILFQGLDFSQEGATLPKNSNHKIVIYDTTFQGTVTAVSPSALFLLSNPK